MRQLKISESITTRDTDSISAFLREINKYEVPIAEHHDLMQAMSILPDRERRVLVMIFGLDGRDLCTHEEIADTMGLSRERTRQIRESGLRHIRSNAASVAALRKYCAA